jgi:thioredoxin-like negative regulator of GroEL
MCWETVAAVDPASAASGGKSLWGPIARMHQAISSGITSRSPRHKKAESQRLLAEANQCIRRGDWQSAVPLLQNASAFDPHHYEIAYRWAQAIRQTADHNAAAKVINQVLRQSGWTESEQQMLQQLRDSPPNH